ncbi:hypothetical protein AB0H86_17310 [Streptomyces sp. NPDC050997]|uniref:hypothetical protein n=1 Tax=Streptomyces sp. NPDC050997 TaxID=3155519 RepID=UPI0034193ED6
MFHAPDPDPGISDTPPSGRTPPRCRRNALPYLFLLITAGTLVAAVMTPRPVQALAAATSALCAVWQLVRSRRR